MLCHSAEEAESIADIPLPFSTLESNAERSALADKSLNWTTLFKFA